MPENDRLGSCLDEINLDFVEQEATPRLLMKLSIQLHLAGLSFSNTVLFLEIFGVDRVRSGSIGYPKDGVLDSGTYEIERGLYDTMSYTSENY